MDIKLEAANKFWQEARDRVRKIAQREGIQVVIREHDDEFLMDLYDNGTMVPDDNGVVKGILEYCGMVPEEPLEIFTTNVTQVWITPGILVGDDSIRLAPETLRGVWGRAYKAGVCWLRVHEGWIHEKSVLVQTSLQSPEEKPQTPLSGG